MSRARSCARTNPNLWQRFIELRERLSEPPPDPDDWTSPQVWAWIDVRTTTKRKVDA